jgi:hypothetical protein
MTKWSKNRSHWIPILPTFKHKHPIVDIKVNFDFCSTSRALRLLSSPYKINRNFRIDKVYDGYQILNY